MGIAYGALRFFFEEGRQQRWTGRVLTLGRQDTAFSLKQLMQAAKDAGYELTPFSRSSGNSTVPHDAFFRLLGFDGVDVLDASDFEGANIIHDLNNPTSDDLADHYDLVFDGGTLEHVFDIATALKSISRIVKIGGRVVHISPMANCIDHGFYCFSPTLFADFYSTNGFQIRSISICRFKDNPAADHWEYIPYDPKRWGTIGALDDFAYFVLVSAMRTSEATH